MVTRISLFLDRLTERFAALIAGLVSSRIEDLRTRVQAEQQSDLEDLARMYDADGKPDIAQTLRDRAGRLVQNNLASDALDIIDAVSQQPLHLTGPASVSTATSASLPQRASKDRRTRTKDSVARNSVTGSGQGQTSEENGAAS